MRLHCDLLTFTNPVQQFRMCSELKFLFVWWFSICIDLLSLEPHKCWLCCAISTLLGKANEGSPDKATEPSVSCSQVNWDQNEVWQLCWRRESSVSAPGIVTHPTTALLPGSDTVWLCRTQFFSRERLTGTLRTHLHKRPVHQSCLKGKRIICYSYGFQPPRFIFSAFSDDWDVFE